MSSTKENHIQYFHCLDFYSGMLVLAIAFDVKTVEGKMRLKLNSVVFVEFLFLQF